MPKKRRDLPQRRARSPQKQQPQGRDSSPQTRRPESPQTRRPKTPQGPTGKRVDMLSSSVLTTKLNDIVDLLLDTEDELSNPKTSNTRKKRLRERESQLTKEISGIRRQLNVIEAKKKIEELEEPYNIFAKRVHNEQVKKYDHAHRPPPMGYGLHNAYGTGDQIRRRYNSQQKRFSKDPREMNAGERAEIALKRRNKLKQELKQGGFIAPVSNKKALSNRRRNTYALLAASNSQIAQEKRDRRAGGGGESSIGRNVARLVSDLGWGGGSGGGGGSIFNMFD